MVCLALAIATFGVSARSAAAQGSSAYVIVPKLPVAIVTMRPGERLTLGQLVDLVPLLPNPIVSVAVAGADGGVRLNNTAGVTRSTLAELLSTVVSATSDGTVTVIIDAQVNLGGVRIESRSVGVLNIAFTASARYRVTPKASPFHMNAGAAYRLRDLVTFEKLDPQALIQNFGFEVTGGVVCTQPSAATTPVACPPVPTGDRYGGVFTEPMLDSRFMATASGRVTLVLYVGVPTGGDPIERFAIDVVVDVSATPPGLVGSTTLPGPVTTTAGGIASSPTTVPPNADEASSSAPPAGQNNATNSTPGPSSSARPTVTTRPKPKAKPTSKTKR